MYTKFLHYLSDIFLEKVYIWSIITNQETKFSDMPYHQKENNETDTSKNRVKKTTSRERKLILLAEDEDLGRNREQEHHPGAGKYYPLRKPREDA